MICVPICSKSCSDVVEQQVWARAVYEFRLCHYSQVLHAYQVTVDVVPVTGNKSFSQHRSKQPVKQGFRVLGSWAGYMGWVVGLRLKPFKAVGLTLHAPERSWVEACRLRLSQNHLMLQLLQQWQHGVIRQGRNTPQAARPSGKHGSNATDGIRGTHALLQHLSHPVPCM